MRRETLGSVRWPHAGFRKITIQVGSAFGHLEERRCPTCDQPTGFIFVPDKTKAGAARHVRSDGLPAGIYAPKKGGVRLENRGMTFEATQPWKALNMSRRTWYRRKKEQGGKNAV